MNNKENKKNEERNKNSMFLIITVLIIIIIILLMKSCTENNNNREVKETSTNIIAIDNIPQIDECQEAPIAYVSGQAITTINSKNPNVYLQNDKVNEDYYLEYEVYVNDIMVYQSKLIPSGSAEPWDAYNNEKIPTGKNEMYYKVNIYNINKELLVRSTINGLRLIKE